MVGIARPARGRAGFAEDIIMASALRKTGIDIVGDMPWGTHFGNNYATRDDTLATPRPYFKAGLEDNVLRAARSALARALVDLYQGIGSCSLEATVPFPQ